MAYRAPVGDRPERWDRDRFMFEHDRERDHHDRHGDREMHETRFEEDDRYIRRGPRLRQPERLRERSVDDRFERRFAAARLRDDQVMIQDRRVYEDERYRRGPRPCSPSPGPAETDFDRRVVIERERIASPSPSPPRRPGQLLRRQSSLDTFERERDHRRRYYDRPPPRRAEYRAPPYVPIPLPRARALPPPRYVERDLDEISVSDPFHYGDDEFHAYHPERVREREIVRTRRRNRSRESRSHHGSSVRSSSRSSTTTSSSMSSSATTATVKSEYPKKGKTRIPQRLVSKRALIDLGYPFEEEV